MILGRAVAPLALSARASLLPPQRRHSKTTRPKTKVGANLVNSCISAGYLGFFLYFSLNWDAYRTMRLDAERGDEQVPRDEHMPREEQVSRDLKEKRDEES